MASPNESDFKAYGQALEQEEPSAYQQLLEALSSEAHPLRTQPNQVTKLINELTLDDVNLLLVNAVPDVGGPADGMAEFDSGMRSSDAVRDTDPWLINFCRMLSDQKEQLKQEPEVVPTEKKLTQFHVLLQQMQMPNKEQCAAIFADMKLLQKDLDENGLKEVKRSLWDYARNIIPELIKKNSDPMALFKLIEKLDLCTAMILVIDRTIEQKQEGSAAVVERDKRAEVNPVSVQQMITNLNLNAIVLHLRGTFQLAQEAMLTLEQASTYYADCDIQQQQAMRNAANIILQSLLQLRASHPEDQQIILLLNNLNTLANTIEIPPQEWQYLKEPEKYDILES